MLAFVGWCFIVIWLGMKVTGYIWLSPTFLVWSVCLYQEFQNSGGIGMLDKFWGKEWITECFEFEILCDHMSETSIRLIVHFWSLVNTLWSDLPSLISICKSKMISHMQESNKFIWNYSWNHAIPKKWSQCTSSFIHCFHALCFQWYVIFCCIYIFHCIPKLTDV